MSQSPADFPQLAPPERILLGPGPSDVPSRVLQALAAPTIGHLDPEYLKIMDETRVMLRTAFRTTNEMTLAMSGTGSAGMETCICNLVEPGDEVLICVNGVFGGRMKDVAQRYGATVHVLETAWGSIFDPHQIQQKLADHPGIKLVGIVHAETSTGAYQPLESISEITHQAGALLLVDAVTSFGGMDLRIDEWKIDACYSGTQKCLSCPPGLSPVTFSPAAMQKVSERKTKVTSWYLDLTMLQNYWGSDRVYHHTAPINMTYALRESLMIILEEGTEARIGRHRLNHDALRAGLEALGLQYIPDSSLTTLNAVHVPDGVCDATVRKQLLNEFGIEIGAGLGPFKGQAWRIGLMGHSSTRRNVMLFLSALESCLAQQGFAFESGAGVSAASAIFNDAPVAV